MKTLCINRSKYFIYLLLVVSLCSCTNAKQSDSKQGSGSTNEVQANERENNTKSNEFDVRFNIISPVFKGKPSFVYSFFILETHNGEKYYNFNDEANYDQWAFPLFFAKKIAYSYLELRYRYGNKDFYSHFKEYKSEIESYLPYVFHLPITDEIQDKEIKELFNKVYYDYKDKQIGLMDSGYGFRKYGFREVDSTVTLERASKAGNYEEYDEIFPEDALAVMI